MGKKIVLADKTIPPLSARTLEEYLGPVKFLPLAEEHESQVGRVNGLAWTAAGGEVLDTEAITIKGKGNLILTGQLGDVMKESAETAYTYIRSRAKELGLVEISMKRWIPISIFPKAPCRKTDLPRGLPWPLRWHPPTPDGKSEVIPP